MMLHRMAFHLSVEVVAMHLDNTAKAYLCNQIGTSPPFLSSLAFQILSLTNKHSITLILAYIPTHLNVVANYLSLGQLLLEWQLFHQIDQAAFHLLGLPEMDLLASSHTTQCQHYYILETPLPLEALGLNAFNHPWMFHVCYVFTHHVKGQLRLLILVAPCLMEVPFLPTVLNMLVNHARVLLLY